MDREEKFQEFLHDLSNDVTVAEGYVKVCLSKKKTQEQKEEYLEKSLEKLKFLSERIRKFKEESR